MTNVDVDTDADADTDTDTDDDACGESGSQILMLISMLVLFFIGFVDVVSFICCCSSICCCYLPVIIWENARASVVSRSDDGRWPRAEMWRVAILELLSRKSGLELLVGAMHYPLPDDAPTVSIGSHCMMACELCQFHRCPSTTRIGLLGSCWRPQLDNLPKPYAHHSGCSK